MRSEEHTSELQSRPHLVCRPSTSTLFPYTTLFRSIVKWLQDNYQCEVVTFTADLGQGEEVEPARAKAQAMGVKEIFIEDLREEFVRDFVFPMFRANTVY